MRRSTYIIVAIIFHITSATLALAQSSPFEQQLIKAQRDNQEAQAKYYEDQVNRNIWQKAADNPVAIGAAIAAFVAFISFYFNYRATLRNQNDTQFFEALKRFGDKDSPTMRSSAAGMLAVIARRRTSLLWRRPYFETTFDQLITGLLLERDAVVRNSIIDSIQQLITVSPFQTAKKLGNFNYKLQNDLVELFGELCATEDVNDPRDISEQLWNEAVNLTIYDRSVLYALTEKRYTKLYVKFQIDLQIYRTLTEGERQGYIDNLKQNLREAANRMRLNVNLCSDAFRLASKGQWLIRRVIIPKFLLINFSHLFLVKAKLQYVDTRWCKLDSVQLQEADLQGANLLGVNLVGAELQKANLSGATLGRAKLSRTNLQDANLSGAILKKVDLQGSNMKNANLSGADLQGANLANASLQGTNLIAADMQRTNLNHASLEGAYLQKANLTKAKFESTNIIPTDMLEVEWWKANFDSQKNLLESLYRDYRQRIPTNPRETHKSVQEFILSARQTDQGQISPH